MKIFFLKCLFHHITELVGFFVTTSYLQFMAFTLLTVSVINGVLQGKVQSFEDCQYGLNLSPSCN